MEKVLSDNTLKWFIKVAILLGVVSFTVGGIIYGEEFIEIRWLGIVFLIILCFVNGYIYAKLG